MALSFPRHPIAVQNDYLSACVGVPTSLTIYTPRTTATALSLGGSRISAMIVLCIYASDIIGAFLVSGDTVATTTSTPVGGASDPSATCCYCCLICFVWHYCSCRYLLSTNSCQSIEARTCNLSTALVQYFPSYQYTPALVSNSATRMNYAIF